MRAPDLTTPALAGGLRVVDLPTALTALGLSASEADVRRVQAEVFPARAPVVDWADLLALVTRLPGAMNWGAIAPTGAQVRRAVNIFQLHDKDHSSEPPCCIRVRARC